MLQKCYNHYFTENPLDFILRFLAMAELEANLAVLIWLNANVGFHSAFFYEGRSKKDNRFVYSSERFR